MVTLKINHLDNVHLVDKMLQAIKPLGIKGDELGLDYFIPEKDKVSLEWLPEVFQKGFVAFLISAPYNTRKLPVDRMIELCVGKRIAGAQQENYRVQCLWEI